MWRSISFKRLTTIWSLHLLQCFHALLLIVGHLVGQSSDFNLLFELLVLFKDSFTAAALNLIVNSLGKENKLLFRRKQRGDDMPISLRNLKFSKCVYWCVYDSDGQCNISLMHLGTKEWIYHLKLCSP